VGQQGRVCYLSLPPPIPAKAVGQDTNPALPQTLREVTGRGVCTRRYDWAVIDRPYSKRLQPVAAVYDRRRFHVQSPGRGNVEAG